MKIYTVVGHYQNGDDDMISAWAVKSFINELDAQRLVTELSANPIAIWDNAVALDHKVRSFYPVTPESAARYSEYEYSENILE